MRIDSVNAQSLYNSYQDIKKPDTAAAAAGIQGRDTVEISAQAAGMRDALTCKAGSENGTDAHTERIAAVKQQIDAGTYRVDAKDVAQSILRGSRLDVNA